MGTVSTRIGRLGVLAVGVGLGAAVAVTPGVAAPGMPDIAISMDSVTLTAFNFDISIWGIDVFDGGGSAHATSAFGDMAIAIGPNATAIAEGGFGDVASAYSTGNDGAIADAGDATVGATGNNFDFASAVGDHVQAASGNFFALTPDTTGSSFDFSSAFGNGTVSLPTLAFAGFNGSGDSASAVGDQVQVNTGFSTDAAHPANFDSASAFGSLTHATTDPTFAVAGGDFASPLGGSNDFAFLNDTLGPVGSYAIAGMGHNFDLADAFGDPLNALSISGDFVSHILPFF